VHGKALHVTDDRGVESLEVYLRGLLPQQRNDIRTLSMDINPAYITAARFHLPAATSKIAFDHFHVAKILCAVVYKTRQMEIKRIPLNDRKSVHRSRYLWLYGSQNLHASRAEKLEAAKLVLPQTSQCWAMKEMARERWLE